MPFQMFKTQRHKVEVATGVVIMDSFYLFLQLCNKKEDKQNGLRWLIRFLLCHTNQDYSEKHISFFLCCTDCDMAHVYTHMWWEFLSSIKTYV